MRYLSGRSFRFAPWPQKTRLAAIAFLTLSLFSCSPPSSPAQPSDIPLARVVGTYSRYQYGPRKVEVSTKNSAITIHADQVKDYAAIFLTGKRAGVGSGNLQDFYSPSGPKIWNQIKSQDGTAFTVTLDFTRLEGWRAFDYLPYGVRVLAMADILKIAPDYEEVIKILLTGRVHNLVSNPSEAPPHTEDEYYDAYAYQQALQFVLLEPSPTREVLSGSLTQSGVETLATQAMFSPVGSRLVKGYDPTEEITSPVYFITHLDPFYDGRHQWTAALQDHASRMKAAGIPTVLFLADRPGWWDDLSFNANIDVDGAREYYLNDGSHLFTLKTNEVTISGAFFGNCASRTGLFSVKSMFVNGVKPPYRVNYFADTLVGAADEIRPGPTLQEYLAQGGREGFIKQVADDYYGFFMKDLSDLTKHRVHFLLFIDEERVFETTFSQGADPAMPSLEVEYFIWDKLDPPAIRGPEFKKTSPTRTSEFEHQFGPQNN